MSVQARIQAAFHSLWTDRRNAAGERVPAEPHEPVPQGSVAGIRALQGKRITFVKGNAEWTRTVHFQDKKNLAWLERRMAADGWLRKEQR